ncbi:hypothetical protein BS47DRAFT_1362488 [Hydnum rufescens UP504]|uniref:Uncharacterized protein n=1 Tax=Hydnum rufescens UP504 TaxID=1448309 RepID=A0A9P6DW68_9AGAM|nr:hypothetical protein BS47DRAFT_1362488 [Hydnum rufescens UP504]
MPEIAQNGFFGVQEYPSWVCHDIIPNCTPESPEASAAADAESAAVMKQWKVDRLQVEECVVHVEIPLIHVSCPNPWHIRPHEGYPGKSSRDDEEHSLSYIASRMFGANDMCETHVAILRDLLGPGPWPSAQTYVVPGFHWVYEYGERIKVYNNEEDDPMFSALKPAASSGVDDDDRMDIFGAIMGNPFDTEFDDTYDGHDEDDDYRREPSPLDPGQENAAKALILAAENGDDSAWQRIELALRGAHGKKRGKSRNGKPTQSDFETALMRLWSMPPLPLPLALPHYLLDPLHLLLDFLMSTLHALWPLFGIPPLALDSSYRRSAARPPEPRPVPMSREPPRAPWGAHGLGSLQSRGRSPHSLPPPPNSGLESHLTPLVAGPLSSAMKPGNNVSWPPPECLRMAHWPALDIEGIDCTEEPMDWVWRYSEHGVLAARRLRPNRRKGAQYHMYLLFKDMAKCDSCLQILAGSLVNNQVESFQYENDLVNCLGVMGVRYMQEAYVNAHSMAEVKELLAVGPIPYLIPLDAIDEMLDYKRFPALIDPCPGPQQSRPMTSVEFDTEWLSRRLYSACQGNPASVTVGMQHMEMQLIAHKTPVKGTPLSFNLNIWPTIGGTMNSDIRQIARWAVADLSSSSVSSNLESFAHTKVRPAWRIILEPELDQPRYFKPTV